MNNPSAKITSQTILKIGAASKALGVSIDTLRRWEKAGKIEAIRTPGGTRLFKVEPPLSLTSSEQTTSLSTEDLLKKADLETFSSVIPALNQVQGKLAGIHIDPDFHQDDKSKFLIGSAGFLGLALVITSLIAASHLSAPKIPKPPPYVSQKLNKDSAVLAVTSSSRFLEVNTDTQINGNLFVRDQINNVTLEGTPSANTINLTSGTTSLDITKSAKLDQDVSTASSPTFAGLTTPALNLSATKNQLVFQSGGPTGTLTWTPTATRTITLPDVTTTLVGIDNTQTITNKTISGSSNTITNIPNSTLTNAKITITAGSNLTGGGEIALGESKSISLKDSPSITGTLTVSGATTLTGATVLSSTLAVTGVTTLTGAATLSSDLTVNGNTTLGDATSDTITTTGRFSSSLIPSSTGAYDLGSSSLKFNNLYFNCSRLEMWRTL